MKDVCNCALREFMSSQFKEVRIKSNMTTVKFAESLKMDARSYIAMEHADNLCCTQTFILFLAAFCPDADALIQELRTIILKMYDNESD